MTPSNLQAINASIESGAFFRISFLLRNLCSKFNAVGVMYEPVNPEDFYSKWIGRAERNVRLWNDAVLRISEIEHTNRWPELR